jgi:hypothetical protein
VRVCPDHCRGRDRWWKRFADSAVPKAVDPYVSSPFVDRIELISQVRHPDTIIWIQYYPRGSRPNSPSTSGRVQWNSVLVPLLNSGSATEKLLVFGRDEELSPRKALAGKDPYQKFRGRPLATAPARPGIRSQHRPGRSRRALWRPPPEFASAAHCAQTFRSPAPLAGPARQ